jgi:hypothetical protein
LNCGTAGQLQTNARWVMEQLKEWSISFDPAHDRTLPHNTAKRKQLDITMVQNR